jgi:hypothetical protein
MLFRVSGMLEHNVPHLPQPQPTTMTCKHLKELYALCESHNLKLSSADLIRIVCPQCGVEEVCPSVLNEEYEIRHREPKPETKDG